MSDDLNEIKAGTYLLIAEFWDEYLSKPGEPFDFKRHRRGAVLDLNIEDARRLVVAKAVLSHDPEHPAHVVDPDGTVREVLPPDPAVTGMVIPEEYFNVLAAELGISPDATSEDVVRAVLDMQASARQVLEENQQLQGQLQQGAAPAAPSGAGGPDTRPESDRIEHILRWVSGDQAKAQIALDGERSSKGDRARPQLVTALEEILTSPGGGS